MNLLDIKQQIITPALNLLPSSMNTPEALCMLLAIGLQESRFEHRQQIGGPAKGFWQFEKNGGVKGVLIHPSTRSFAHSVCQARQIDPSPEAVYQALTTDDLLAATFARLLLYSDPSPLPKLGDSSISWNLYLRVWRPGKPHPATWPALYAQALKNS